MDDASTVVMFAKYQERLLKIFFSFRLKESGNNLDSLSRLSSLFISLVGPVIELIQTIPVSMIQSNVFDCNGNTFSCIGSVITSPHQIIGSTTITQNYVIGAISIVLLLCVYLCCFNVDKVQTSNGRSVRATVMPYVTYLLFSIYLMDLICFWTLQFSCRALEYNRGIENACDTPNSIIILVITIPVLFSIFVFSIWFARLSPRLRLSGGGSFVIRHTKTELWLVVSRFILAGVFVGGMNLKSQFDNESNSDDHRTILIVLRCISLIISLCVFVSQVLHVPYALKIDNRARCAQLGAVVSISIMSIVYDISNVGTEVPSSYMWACVVAGLTVGALIAPLRSSRIVHAVEEDINAQEGFLDVSYCDELLAMCLSDVSIKISGHHIVHAQQQNPTPSQSYRISSQTPHRTPRSVTGSSYQGRQQYGFPGYDTGNLALGFSDDKRFDSNFISSSDPMKETKKKLSLYLTSATYQRLSSLIFFDTDVEIGLRSILEDWKMLSTERQSHYRAAIFQLFAALLFQRPQKVSGPLIHTWLGILCLAINNDPKSATRAAKLASIIQATKQDKSNQHSGAQGSDNAMSLTQPSRWKVFVSIVSCGTFGASLENLNMCYLLQKAAEAARADAESRRARREGISDLPAFRRGCMEVVSAHSHAVNCLKSFARAATVVSLQQIQMEKNALNITDKNDKLQVFSSTMKPSEASQSDVRLLLSSALKAVSDAENAAINLSLQHPRATIAERLLKALRQQLFLDDYEVEIVDEDLNGNKENDKKSNKTNMKSKHDNFDDTVDTMSDMDDDEDDDDHETDENQNSSSSGKATSNLGMLDGVENRLDILLSSVNFRMQTGLSERSTNFSSRSANNSDTSSVCSSVKVSDKRLVLDDDDDEFDVHNLRGNTDGSNFASMANKHEIDGANDMVANLGVTKYYTSGHRPVTTSEKAHERQAKSNITSQICEQGNFHLKIFRLWNVGFTSVLAIIGVIYFLLWLDAFKAWSGSIDYIREAALLFTEGMPDTCNELRQSTSALSNLQWAVFTPLSEIFHNGYDTANPTDTSQWGKILVLSNAIHHLDTYGGPTLIQSLCHESLTLVDGGRTMKSCSSYYPYLNDNYVVSADLTNSAATITPYVMTDEPDWWDNTFNTYIPKYLPFQLLGVNGTSFVRILDDSTSEIVVLYPVYQRNGYPAVFEMTFEGTDNEISWHDSIVTLNNLMSNMQISLRRFIVLLQGGSWDITQDYTAEVTQNSTHMNRMKPFMKWLTHPWSDRVEINPHDSNSNLLFTYPLYNSRLTMNNAKTVHIVELAQDFIVSIQDYIRAVRPSLISSLISHDISSLDTDILTSVVYKTRFSLNSCSSTVVVDSVLRILNALESSARSALDTAVDVIYMCRIAGCILIALAVIITIFVNKKFLTAFDRVDNQSLALALLKNIPPICSRAISIALLKLPNTEKGIFDPENPDAAKAILGNPYNTDSYYLEEQRKKEAIINSQQRQNHLINNLMHNYLVNSSKNLRLPSNAVVARPKTREIIENKKSDLSHQSMNEQLENRNSIINDVHRNNSVDNHGDGELLFINNKSNNTNENIKNNNFVEQNNESDMFDKPFEDSLALNDDVNEGNSPYLTHQTEDKRANKKAFSLKINTLNEKSKKIDSGISPIDQQPDDISFTPNSSPAHNHHNSSKMIVPRIEVNEPNNLISPGAKQPLSSSIKSPIRSENKSLSKSHLEDKQQSPVSTPILHEDKNRNKDVQSPYVLSTPEYTIISGEDASQDERKDLDPFSSPERQSESKSIKSPKRKIIAMVKKSVRRKKNPEDVISPPRNPQSDDENLSRNDATLVKLTPVYTIPSSHVNDTAHQAVLQDDFNINVKKLNVPVSTKKDFMLKRIKHAIHRFTSFISPTVKHRDYNRNERRLVVTLSKTKLSAKSFWLLILLLIALLVCSSLHANRMMNVTNILDSANQILYILTQLGGATYLMNDVISPGSLKFRSSDVVSQLLTTQETTSKIRTLFENLLMMDSIEDKDIMFGRATQEREQLLYSPQCFAPTARQCINPAASDIQTDVSIKDASIFSTGLYESVITLLYRMELDVNNTVTQIYSLYPDYANTQFGGDDLRSSIPPPSLALRSTSWYTEAYSTHIAPGVRLLYSSVYDEVDGLVKSTKVIWGVCLAVYILVCIGIILMFEWLYRNQQKELKEILIFIRMIPARTLARAGCVNVQEQTSKQNRLANKRYKNAQMEYLRQNNR